MARPKPEAEKVATPLVSRQIRMATAGKWQGIAEITFVFGSGSAIEAGLVQHPEVHAHAQKLTELSCGVEESQH